MDLFIELSSDVPGKAREILKEMADLEVISFVEFIGVTSAPAGNVASAFCQADRQRLNDIRDTLGDDVRQFHFFCPIFREIGMDDGNGIVIWNLPETVEDARAELPAEVFDFWGLDDYYEEISM
jgi:hypothetical protein